MVGLMGGRSVLRKTEKARRSALMKTRSAREKVAESFDIGGTADILN